MTVKKQNDKLLQIKPIRIAVLIISVLFLIVSIITAIVNVWMIDSTENRIVGIDMITEHDYDCILILGAGVRDDGSPSSMLEDRLRTGISLFEGGYSNTILMSGDHGREEYDEVNTMKDYAVDNGIPSDRVFMDHAGFSTYDTLYRAKEIFGAEKVIIVTQKYHLYRALAIADSLGIEAVGVSADLRPYYGQFGREVREVAARLKDYFYILMRPEPTFLGDRISLSGSGEVTNG